MDTDSIILKIIGLAIFFGIVRYWYQKIQEERLFGAKSVLEAIRGKANMILAILSFLPVTIAIVLWFQHDSLLKDRAVIDMNPSLCEKMEHTFYKRMCYESIVSRCHSKRTMSYLSTKTCEDARKMILFK